MDEETSLVLKKRRGKYRRNTGLLLSAMGCACDSTSAFSSITRNIVTVDLANENYNNTNSLLLRSSDDEDTDERRREHDQAAIKASMKLIDHDTKHEGILSRVTKLVPIPKNDDDAVGDYLRFIHRRYNRFHDEIDEVGHVVSSATLNSPEIGSVRWTWDWLFSSPIEKTTKQQQQDALYIIGLADIASKHAKVKNKNVFDPEGKLSVITPPLKALDQINNTTFP